MRSVAICGALLGLASAGPVSRRDFTFPDSSCSIGDKAKLYGELEAAQELAEHAAAGVAGPYYEAFFAESVRTAAFEAGVSAEFARVATLLKRNDQSGGVFSVTCDNATPKCQAGLFVESGGDTLNFCDAYFDSDLIESSEDTQDNCATLDIVQAQKSRSAVIVRSILKTAGGTAKDYSFGYSAALELAAGTFDRSTVPYANPADVLCPSAADPSQEGVCPADASAANADSWSFVAAGIAYSVLCNRAVTLPEPGNDTPIVWG